MVAKASVKPQVRFDTQWGPYYLESGASEVIKDLWESIFKKPRSIDSFFASLTSTRHLTQRQALLIWMFLRLNKQYRSDSRLPIEDSPSKWHMPKLISPKILNPIPKEKKFIRTIFERPTLKAINLKRKTDLFEHQLLIDNPELQPKNYLFLRIPPYTSDTEILSVVRIWREGLLEPTSFKQLKGSNKSTVIHCLLALYLSARPENKDLAKAFRAASNDIFLDKSKNQPHRSKSKVQSFLIRAGEIRDSAPFNFLFSAG